MHEGFFGWSLENVSKGIVEMKYIIESITDEKAWNKFLKTEGIGVQGVQTRLKRNVRFESK